MNLEALSRRLELTQILREQLEAIERTNPAHADLIRRTLKRDGINLTFSA